MPRSVLKRIPFKKGDRVELIVATDCDGRIRRGMRGTVEDSGLITVGVIWDNLTTGHDLAGQLHGPESRKGWNVSYHEIRLCEVKVTCPKCKNIVEEDLLGLCPECAWVLKQ